MAISVLLVEDVPELRSVIRQALQIRRGFTVVAEADDGAGAILCAARHQPEIVVLDLGLPDLAGHEVLSRLRAISPGSQIVVYTGSSAAHELPLAGDVDAYVTKDRDVSYLVDLLSRLGRPRHESAAVELGPNPRDVATARRFVGVRCEDWGCGDLVDDAELVASELVTNALLHGAGRCELRLALSDAALRLQVVDEGDGMPDPQNAGQGDEHGRGLLLVSALCAAWGVEALPGGGKVVWAELLRPLPGPGADDPPGQPAGGRRSHDAGRRTGRPGTDPPASGGTAGGPAPSHSVAVAHRRTTSATNRPTGPAAPEWRGRR
jgi:CheY-like chemotaxis protein